MTGKTIVYKGINYEVKKWQQNGADAEISIEPQSQTLLRLLRGIYLGNVPFVYSWRTDRYAVYHSSSPAIETEAAP